LTAILLSGAPARAADDLSYNDPGMHYQAPAGWTRIPIPAEAVGQDGVPAAIFVFKADNRVKRTLTITIATFDGALNEFVSDRTQAIRQSTSSSSSSSQTGSDQNEDTASTYINKRQSTQTTNGMPAEEIVWTLTPPQSTQIRSYEYLMIDGQRSIDVKYSGQVGDVGDTDAADVLASLYVVAYPKVRSTP